MVMLTTAFDVSLDEPQHRFLIMAGFVSDAAEWANFDTLWRARLARDNLAYFHMQRFAHSTSHPTRPFDSTWIGQEDRREALISDLLDILVGHAYHKFGVIMQSDATNAVARIFGQEKLTMIENAGIMTVCEVETWRLRNHYQRKAEHIFEDGDAGRGRLADAIKKATGDRPLFRQKKDNPAKGVVAFTPLQAADILAFEIKKLAELKGNRFPPNYRFRFPYQQINRMPGQPKLFNMDTAADIEALGLDCGGSSTRR